MPAVRWGKDNSRLHNLHAINRAGHDDRLALSGLCRSDQYILHNAVALEDHMLSATDSPGDQGPRVALDLEAKSPLTPQG